MSEEIKEEVEEYEPIPFAILRAVKDERNRNGWALEGRYRKIKEKTKEKNAAN